MKHLALLAPLALAACAQPQLDAALPRSGSKAVVARIVAGEAERQLGARWVPVAIRLTRIESGFRCNARSRVGARGVLQVMPRSAIALGYAPGRLYECHYGAAAGVAHMKRCIEVGVRTGAQMAACHVAGWAGWNRRLAGWAERYKWSYVRMATR